MSKGQLTREMILERSAQLFSRQGFFGSSLSDIMHETGLEKGGIYNHFSSKEQLAIEAFDYSIGLIEQRIGIALAGKTHAVDRLLAMIGVFRDLIDNPILVGGCPILNTAVEADDAHPVLRARAQKAMDDLRETLQRIITRGIERSQLRPDIPIDTITSLLIASMEGAVMMSKLYGNNTDIHRVAEYMSTYVRSLATA